MRGLQAQGVVSFQSTPPARGATTFQAWVLGLYSNFNPRPPRGGRHSRFSSLPWAAIFQSTPPARGATCRSGRTRTMRSDFNPRPPRGGRRPDGKQCYEAIEFQSTPPARGATIDNQITPFMADISIHAPREGGDDAHCIAQIDLLQISIHAPREGGDGSANITCGMSSHFNPRPPRGGRPVQQRSA